MRSAAAQAPSPLPSSASSEERSCSARNDPSWKSASSQRSSASPSSRSSSAAPSLPIRTRAVSPRKTSSRVGSPGGCVAAIGSTGRTPNGRQSSRSKSTGPAAIGPQVASRSAVTASAISPGASGGSPPSAGIGCSSSSTHIRSGSRPKLSGARRAASGQCATSSPSAACRTREPVSERNRLAHLDPDERGDRGVDALVPEHRLLELRVRPVEGVVVPVEAAARLGDVGHERQQDGSEERVLGLGVRMSTGEDRRGRLAAERLERDRRVAAAEQPSAASLDEAADERPVLVERRAVPASRAPRRRTRSRRPARPRARRRRRRRGRSRAGPNEGAVRAPRSLTRRPGVSPPWHVGHQ